MPRSEVRSLVTRLLAVPTKPICDKCIELVLGYEFDTVNHVNRPLAEDGTIHRGHGQCSVCGDMRLVNQIAGKS